VKVLSSLNEDVGNPVLDKMTEKQRKKRLRADIAFSLPFFCFLGYEGLHDGWNVDISMLFMMLAMCASHSFYPLSFVLAVEELGL